jgi:hypothetical protein
VRPALPLLTLTLALAACAAPPAGPRLLSPAEIAQATQGTTAAPDNAALQGRAARLSARAAALRATSIEVHEQQLLRRRAAGLARDAAGGATGG